MTDSISKETSVHPAGLFDDDHDISTQASALDRMTSCKSNNTRALRRGDENLYCLDGRHFRADPTQLRSVQSLRQRASVLTGWPITEIGLAQGGEILSSDGLGFDPNCNLCIFNTAGGTIASTAPGCLGFAMKGLPPAATAAYAMWHTARVTKGSSGLVFNIEKQMDRLKVTVLDSNVVRVYLIAFPACTRRDDTWKEMKQKEMRLNQSSSDVNPCVVDLCDGEGMVYAKDVQWQENLSYFASPRPRKWFQVKVNLVFNQAPEDGTVVAWCIKENMVWFRRQYNLEYIDLDVYEATIHGRRTLLMEAVHPSAGKQNPEYIPLVAQAHHLFDALSTSPDNFAEAYGANNKAALANYRQNEAMLRELGIDRQVWKSTEGLQNSICHREHSDLQRKYYIVLDNKDLFRPIYQNAEPIPGSSEPLCQYRIMYESVRAESPLRLKIGIALARKQMELLKSSMTTRADMRICLSAANRAELDEQGGDDRVLSLAVHNYEEAVRQWDSVRFGGPVLTRILSSNWQQLRTELGEATRELGVEKSQVTDFMRRASDLVMEQILTAEGRRTLLARIRGLGVEKSQVVDFLKRASNLVMVMSQTEQGRKTLVGAVADLGMTPTNGAFFLKRATEAMIKRAIDPEGRGTLLQAVNSLGIPTEDAHLFYGSSSDVVVDTAMTVEGRERIMGLAGDTEPGRLATFVSRLTEQQLQDDDVPIQDRKRKRVVFEEHEDKLITQGVKDGLKSRDIASKLPGRTRDDVCRRIRKLRKRADCMENSSGSSAKKETRADHIKISWSADEEQTLIAGIGRGLARRAIAELLPGRSENQVKCKAAALRKAGRL